MKYLHALHARVTDRDHASRHGSIVRRGAGSFGPLYGVRWDDGKYSLENEFRIRPAHGGAAHRNHSARGKRAWRHRSRNRALGVVGTASVGDRGTVKLKGRLEVVDYRKKKRAKVVESSEMPSEEFFAIPEDPEASAPATKAAARRRGRGRLTKTAYLDAAEARGNIPPDQLVAFDAVWRSLWPTGLATLTERFAEWVEEHPADLAEYQEKYVAKREKQLEKEQRAQERAARKVA